MKASVMRKIGEVGVIVLTIILAAPVDADSNRRQPHAEMRQILEAMTHLMPLALSETTWADGANQAEIKRWLGLLAERAKAVEKHGEARDKGFRFLSRSLSENVEEAEEIREKV